MYPWDYKLEKQAGSILQITAFIITAVELFKNFIKDIR